MQERRIHAATMATTIALCLLALSGAVWVLARWEIRDQREELARLADHQVRLLTGMVWLTGDPERAVREYIRSLAGREPLVESSEIALARREGEGIVWLLSATGLPGQPLPRTPWTPQADHPMARALRGETGTMVGRDAQGVRVISAYQHIPALGLGLTAEVDLAQFVQPFVRLWIISGATLVLIILVSGELVLHLGKFFRQRLRESEALNEIIVSSALDGLVTTDAAGAVLSFNPAAERIFGLRAPDVIGRRIQTLIPAPLGETPPPFGPGGDPEAMRGVVREVQGRRADGSPVPLEITVSQIPIEGRPVYVGILRDITERRRAEEELAERTRLLEKANASLRRRNEDLDEFTHIASHDLQEPLRKLTAFSALLAEDLGRDLPEAAARDLAFITDAAARMQRLVQDLLALSRAGRQAIRRERVALGDCVDEALRDLALRVEETRALIHRDPLPEVWGDRTMITQLYQNLLSNALKFTVPGRRPEIAITCERRDGALVLGVRDNGIGVASEQAEQIFSPFVRLHGRGEYEGSGIGLAICRKVVERLGGEIWLESSPGAGAHFRFTLSERRRDRP